jgi:tetratricopeptide (TPR) repeat protein
MTFEFRGRAVARCAVGILALGTAGILAAGAETPGSAPAIRSLIADGQYAAAKQAAVDEVARAESAAGKDSLETAEAIDLLVVASWRYGEGSDPATRALAERALTIKQSLLGEDDPHLAASLLNLAILLSDAAQLPEAKRALERAIALTQAAGAPDENLLAGCRERLAIVLGNSGKHADARALLDQALQAREKSAGPESAEVAQTLTTLGGLLTNMGDLKGARAALERALAIRERLLGPDHPETASTLYRMAILARKAGDLQTAAPLAERAAAIRERSLSPGCPEIAATLGALAGIRAEEGRLEEARDLDERVLSMREAAFGPSHPAVATSLKSLADVLNQMGDTSAARQAFERALGIEEATLGSAHPQVALSLTNLAFVMLELGDLETSRAYYERALAIQEKALGPEHPQLGTTLVSLGTVLDALGDHVAARARLERARAMLEKLLGPDHPDVAWALNSLADSYLATHDWEKARPLLDLDRQILIARVGPEHARVGFVENSLGRLLRESGDPAGSLAHFDAAQAIWEKSLGPRHPILAENLADRALARWRTGAYPEAIDDGLNAAGIARDAIQDASRYLSERESLRYKELHQSGLHLALSALALGGAGVCDAACLERVWDAVIRSRALVLDAVATRQRLAHASDAPEVIGLLRTLEAARSRMARLFASGSEFPTAGADRQRLDEARAAKESAERALAARIALHVDGAAGAPIGFAEVKAALPAGGALVSYVRYERTRSAASGGVPPPASEPGAAPPAPAGAYLALWLTAGAVHAAPLGSADTVDRAIDAWRREVSSAPKDLDAMTRYRAAGQKLDRAIWRPIAAALGPPRQVFVVPDGAIDLVSLATLPAAGDRYVLETGPLIHYLSAERDLARVADPPASPGGWMVLGGPDFDAAAGTPVVGAPIAGAARAGPRSICPELGALRFDPLPGALAEADEVAALSVAGTAARGDSPARGDGHGRGDGAAGGGAGPAIARLSGAGATEAAFKATAPGRTILHLATHGFFVSSDCEAVREEPLLGAGLALAGANRRAESAGADAANDGLLTAEEIAALDLHGVEWAVLSSCGSGLGRVQAGEGVLGLRRAFEIAGVRTEIMSLWSVEDHAARDWIGRLYAHRRAGSTTAEAMRQASRDLIAARRKAGTVTHPYYWGAFVATGDWK